MTVYVDRRYRWQTIEQIGLQIRDPAWLLCQRRDRYGEMFTRYRDVNGVQTLHLLVLVKTTFYDDAESD